MHEAQVLVLTFAILIRILCCGPSCSDIRSKAIPIGICGSTWTKPLHTMLQHLLLSDVALLSGKQKL